MSIDYTQHDHLDHIVTITINRPEARNSLDAHFRDLAHAWAAFRDDVNLKISCGCR